MLAVSNTVKKKDIYQLNTSIIVKSFHSWNNSRDNEVDFVIGEYNQFIN